jgi:hypothetical protein
MLQQVLKVRKVHLKALPQTTLLLLCDWQIGELFQFLLWFYSYGYLADFPTSQVSPAYLGKGGRKPAKSSGSRHSLALRRRKLWHVVHGYLCEGPIILVGGF